MGALTENTLHERYDWLISFAKPAKKPTSNVKKI